MSNLRRVSTKLYRNLLLTSYNKPVVTMPFFWKILCSHCRFYFVYRRLSIVQLSLRDRVYILDVIALAEQVPENFLLAFGNAFFANENVLKLGEAVTHLQTRYWGCFT